MLGAREIVSQKTSPYATGADFCRIFEKNMDRFYLLSFLLTGDQALAEQCFVRGLEDSSKGNPVFKEWAGSWARRTIIQNAIRAIGPRPANSRAEASALDQSADPPSSERAEIAAIVQLPVFERFAFVMSVLEGYSEQECSLLLRCTRGEIVQARSSALRQVAVSVGLRRKLASIGRQEELLGDQGAARPFEDLPPFAASA